MDPQNELWESLQKELAGQRAASAFDTSDQAEREAELKEISDTFERYRNTDFGRKLYIIQNGIYGVDIQPIATQIAKLRFFISLAIDQESNDDPDANYGIKPLPNLETALRRRRQPAEIGSPCADGPGRNGRSAAAPWENPRQTGNDISTPRRASRNSDTGAKTSGCGKSRRLRWKKPASRPPQQSR